MNAYTHIHTTTKMHKNFVRKQETNAKMVNEGRE